MPHHSQLRQYMSSPKRSFHVAAMLQTSLQCGSHSKTSSRSLQLQLGFHLAKSHTNQKVLPTQPSRFPHKLPNCKSMFWFRFGVLTTASYACACHLQMDASCHRSVSKFVAMASVQKHAPKPLKWGKVQMGQISHQLNKNYLHNTQAFLTSCHALKLRFDRDLASLPQPSTSVHVISRWKLPCHRPLQRIQGLPDIQPFKQWSQLASPTSVQGVPQVQASHLEAFSMNLYSRNNGRLLDNVQLDDMMVWIHPHCSRLFQVKGTLHASMVDHQPLPHLVALIRRCSM